MRPAASSTLARFAATAVLVSAVLLPRSHRADAGAEEPAKAPAGGDAVREIRVLAVAGREYRTFYPDWQQRTGELVAAASRRIEPALGLRFTVADYRAWDYEQAPKTAGEGFRRLHQIEPGDCDLVVAFTLVTFPGPTAGAEIRGVSNFFSQYVLIPDQWGARGATTRLVHELCHTFGAFHVADPVSVMRPAFERTPSKFTFGEAAQQVVRLTRDVDLRRGVESLDAKTMAKVRSLYRQQHHPLERAADDPIVCGYRYQAHRAEWAGDTERAKALTETAERLAADPEQGGTP